MSAQTHEERLREMAKYANGSYEPYAIDGSDRAACDAGATALAITREIAEMGASNSMDDPCFFCDGDIVHEPDCLYLRCVELHATR